jgi:SRSO17 transposase
LGKIGNCQIGVSLSLSGDYCCIPLDFELYMPEAWCGDSDRREKAKVPKCLVFRKKWEIALDMIERVGKWNIPKGTVTGDAAYGSSAEFRLRLVEMGYDYVLAVSKETSVFFPAESRTKGVQVKDLGMQLPAEAWSKVSWREGKKGKLVGRFAALRVTPAHGYEQHNKKKEGVSWLLIEWPEGASEPLNCYLSNLGPETTIEKLVYIAKIRWYIEQNYQQLKTELGLDQFEGRSFPGWHHHVTLSMIAFDFLTVERMRCKKNYLVELAAS